MPVLAGSFTANDALAYPPVFYVRENWTDDWMPFPEARLISANVSTAGHGDSKLQFLTEYGRISHPWDTTYATLEPLRLRGWWIRMDLIGPQGQVTQFVGKVFGETREMQGASVTRSGKQVWSAFGPMTLLDRIDVYRGWFDRVEMIGDQYEMEGESYPLDWMPSINLFDESGILVGNRSESLDDDGVYVYGAEGVWTHRQYVDMLLKKYATVEGEPEWILTGQTELLDSLETVVELDEVERLGDLIRKLISPKYGVDFVIRYFTYTDEFTSLEVECFALEVFALLGQEITFGGATLPTNPRAIRYVPGVYQWQKRTVVEQSDLERFHTLKIVGPRTVVCCSLRGSDSAVNPIVPNTPGWGGGVAGVAEMTGTWDPALQIEYEEAGGAGSGFYSDEHDNIRSSPRFEAVFCEWAAPFPWASPNPRNVMEILTLGHSSAIGECDVVDYIITANLPDSLWQDRLAQTLSWTPLRKNTDYSTDPATELAQDDRSSECLAPMAFLTRFLPAGWALPRYVRADWAGIGVSPLEFDFGVKVQCSPNHLIAKGITGTTMQETTVQPEFYQQLMVVTFAFRCDQRPTAVNYATEDAADNPMDGIRVVFAEDFEHWVLSPRTVTGVDVNQRLQYSGNLVRVLRDDHEKIAPVMAGLISRHQRARARVEITGEGLIPWAGLLGAILTAVEEAGDTQEIQAPLTSVSWTSNDSGEQTTRIETGFAGSEVQS